MKKYKQKLGMIFFFFLVHKPNEYWRNVITAALANCIFITFLSAVKHNTVQCVSAKKFVNRELHCRCREIKRGHFPLNC